MNGKRKSKPLTNQRTADRKASPVLVPVRHVHREREFGVGYGNSSGYGYDTHFTDGHVDPMFRFK